MKMEQNSPRKTPDPVARIAFVITELEVGGAERCLVNLATRIDRTRFEPLVISLAPRPVAGKDALVVQLEQAGVPTRFLNRQLTSQFLSGFALLARLLREHRPHIVQTFLFHANVLGAMAARRVSVPHLAAGIRVADPRRWRSWVERWACRAADRFVCVSQQVAKHSVSRGYPAHRLAVIANGVDLDRFAGAPPADLSELGLPRQRKAIVYVGRLDAQKGLDDLLRVCPRVFDALPQHDLVLVGEGPQRQALTKLAKDHGQASRVHFAGWQANVPAILAAAEMLVLPSRWEGMPNVILEAMAAGRPVVATRVEGVEEALGEFANEQCAAAGDTNRFADLIIQLAQNPQLAAELGSRNRERVAQEFSLDAMVAKYSQLYASLLAS